MISQHIGNSILPPLPADFSNIVWRGRACSPNAPEPIPALRWSDYKAYERTGSRQHDKPRGEVCARLDRAACAVIMGDDSQLDELHDLIWAVCERSCWWIAAHEFTAPIDLGVAMVGQTFAFIEATLGGRLDPEVRTRMADEVRRRVITPFLEPPIDYWWQYITNNWNAVCHAGVGISALVFEKDPARLDTVFEKIARNIPRFMDGFADDGGCSEGPGYWRYGVTNFAILAHAVHCFTRGETNLAVDPKWARVAAYPANVTVAPGRDLTFSDTHDTVGYVPLCTANILRDLTGYADLFPLCENRDGKPVVRNLYDLLMAPRQPPDFGSTPWKTDAFLPSLAIAKLHGAGGLVLGVKAGNNAEHHNHNDVGAFLLFQDGAQWFADLGAPVYSAKTFSPQRYESLFTCSRGHCVPVVDGQYQKEGGEFCGTLSLDENGVKNGVKTAVVEFAKAYGVPALKSLTRSLTLSTIEPVLKLEDRFEFDGAGLPVKEVFITALPVERGATANEVTLTHPAGRRGILRALTPGVFGVGELHEESKESPMGLLFRRITFTPANDKLESLSYVAFEFTVS